MEPENHLFRFHVLFPGCIQTTWIVTHQDGFFSNRSALQGPPGTLERPQINGSPICTADMVDCPALTPTECGAIF